MTYEKFAAIGQFILKHEGHLADNKNDPGGITNYGISLRYLIGIGAVDPKDGYLYGDMDHNGVIDDNDIKLMTPEEALKIYQTQWWERYGYDRIGFLPLAAKVMDFSVNAGPKRAAILLQRTFNECDVTGAPLVVDGSAGNATLNAVNAFSGQKLILAQYKLAMIDFYLGLKKTMFIEGWTRRALDDLLLN